VPKNLRDRIERKHITLKTLQLPQYTALFFNQSNNEVLKDKDIRMALAKAVDKDRILKETLRGEGQIISSPVLPGFPGYDAELGKIAFNIDEANKLLDKTWPRLTAEEYMAGREKTAIEEWKKGNVRVSSTPSSTDPAVLEAQAKEEIKKRLTEEINQTQTFYRKNKEGEILQINLVTVGTEEYKQAAGLVAGFWQGVGVQTNVHYVAARDFSREVLKTRNYDVLLYGEIVGSDPDQYPFWHSTQVNFPGLNLAGYVNRNADGLLQKARESGDEKEKSDLYKKFQEILLGELPAIFLYSPTYTYALSDEIKGIDVNRVAQPADRFADITSWYIKTKGQWNFAK
jgi:peptide/nickel transport system substrate-binding protein